MKKFRFRKFQVYKDALVFRKDVRKMVFDYFPKEEHFILGDQTIRAATSVVLNIAEGADRSTDKDFANFLNKSHTSLNEIVSCLDVAYMEKYISLEVHTVFLVRAEKLANQLTAFRKALLEK